MGRGLLAPACSLPASIPPCPHSHISPEAPTPPTHLWSRRHLRRGSCCTTSPCRGAAPRWPRRPGRALQDGRWAGRQPRLPQPAGSCNWLFASGSQSQPEQGCLPTPSAPSPLPVLPARAPPTRQGGIGVEGGRLVGVLSVAQPLGQFHGNAHLGGRALAHGAPQPLRHRAAAKYEAGGTQLRNIAGAKAHNGMVRSRKSNQKKQQHYC